MRAPICAYLRLWAVLIPTPSVGDPLHRTDELNPLAEFPFREKKFVNYIINK